METYVLEIDSREKAMLQNALIGFRKKLGLKEDDPVAQLLYRIQTLGDRKRHGPEKE